MIKTSSWIQSLDPQLISCVLPTYNRPRFLVFSLQSILNQYLNDFKVEVIVVDDGSSSFNQKMNNEICESYKKCDLDITYIPLEKNTGTVSIPRNIGISHINGRTIAPTDDDCFFEPYKLDSLFTTLRDVHDSYTPLVFGNRIESQYKNGIYEKIKTVQSKHQDCRMPGIDNGQFIYLAEIYESIDPVLAINACDWELYKQIEKIGNFVHVDEVVCNYIWHGNNSSLTPKPKRIDPYSVIKNYIDYFKDGPYKEKILCKLK